MILIGLFSFYKLSFPVWSKSNCSGVILYLYIFFLFVFLCPKYETTSGGEVQVLELWGCCRNKFIAITFLSIPCIEYDSKLRQVVKIRF